MRPTRKTEADCSASEVDACVGAADDAVAIGFLLPNLLLRVGAPTPRFKIFPAFEFAVLKAMHLMLLLLLFLPPLLLAVAEVEHRTTDANALMLCLWITIDPRKKRPQMHYLGFYNFCLLFAFSPFLTAFPHSKTRRTKPNMALIVGDDFQHILRVLNTNVDGREKVR